MVSISAVLHFEPRDCKLCSFLVLNRWATSRQHPVGPSPPPTAARPASLEGGIGYTLLIICMAINSHICYTLKVKGKKKVTVQFLPF